MTYLPIWRPSTTWCVHIPPWGGSLPPASGKSRAPPPPKPDACITLVHPAFSPRFVSVFPGGAQSYGCIQRTAGFLFHKVKFIPPHLSTAGHKCGLPLIHFVFMVRILWSAACFYSEVRDAQKYDDTEKMRMALWKKSPSACPVLCLQLIY